MPEANAAKDQAPLSLAEFVELPIARRIECVRASGAPRRSVAATLMLVLMLGRPRTCVPGMLTYALGAGFVGVSLGARPLIQALLCFLGAFVANLENTYTDLEEDSHNLPGRTHLVYQLGYRRLSQVIIGLQAAMLGVALCLDIYNFVFMIVALLIVHQYSFAPLRAKARPFAGMLVFTGVVTYPYFVGLLADPTFEFARGLLDWLGGGEGRVEHLAFVVMGAFVAQWFIAKAMFKNVPDYYGDRAGGLRTSATIFPSWTAAASAAALVTTATYTAFCLLVVFGLVPPRMLLALLFLPLVAWNCVRLIRAQDGAKGNQCLKTDMVISVAFIASVLLLAHPTTLSVVAVLAGGATILLSDWLAIDSRRAQDT